MRYYDKGVVIVLALLIGGCHNCSDLKADVVTSGFRSSHAGELPRNWDEISTSCSLAEQDEIRAIVFKGEIEDVPIAGH